MDTITLTNELIRDEGLRLKPYTDTDGKLTLGVGRNLTDVGISEAEARSLLANDIARATRALGEFPWWRDMSDARQRALANLAFNIGIGGVKGFPKMLAALEAGNYNAAADELLDSRYATQVGQRAQRLAELIRLG